jgi:hypothetical protein
MVLLPHFDVRTIRDSLLLALAVTGEVGVVGVPSRGVGVGVGAGMGAAIATDGTTLIPTGGTVTDGGPLTWPGGSRVGAVEGAFVGTVGGVVEGELVTTVLATVLATLGGAVGVELDDSGMVLDEPEPEPPLPEPDEPEPPPPDPLSEANAPVAILTLISTPNINVTRRIIGHHHWIAQTSARPGSGFPHRYVER